MSKNATPTSTAGLGPLEAYSRAAARLLLRDPAKWRGFDFWGVHGEGIHVRGRVGKYGKVGNVFVSNAEAAKEAVNGK